MKTRTRNHGWGLCAAAAAGSWLLLSPASLVGQDAGACPDGSVPRGDIGISSLECENCTMYTVGDGGVLRWVFNSEPRINGVAEGSPVAGKIREGDALVAVDGHLITTSEGGRRFANLVPNREVAIVVRRGNTERTVTVVPERECPRSSGAALARAAPLPDAAPAAPAGVAAPPEAPADRAVPLPDAAPTAGVAVSAVPRPTYSLLPSGWFGFGIQCSDCRWSVEEDTGASEWEFSQAPEISSVREGSPAEAAGLRRGDVLLEIDGVSLVSEEGGRRFGSIEPGETVEWTYRRAGQVRKTRATAGQRPDLPPTAPLPPTPDEEPTAYGLARTYAVDGTRKLRYSGLVGPTSVEVRGTGSVVVNIIEPGQEIEIVTSDSRTRIRLEEEK